MSTKASVASLSSHLGYWLRYVSNHVSQAFARKLEDRGVTVAEWVMLRELYDEESLGPSRLAERLGLTRGAISKLADRLIIKGLIARTEGSDDLRTHSLALTLTGEGMVPELAGLADLNDAEFFADLSTEDRVMLERVLKGIIARRGLKSIPTH